MKAFAVAGAFGLSNCRAEDRPDPAPGPGQVAVRVRAVSLNYRDLLVADGEYNPKLPLPRVLGSDCAGEVAAVGAGVTTARVGDRVVGCFMQDYADGPPTAEAARTALGADRDGVLAETVVLAEGGVLPVPPGMTFEQAATLPCAAVTAWNVLTGGGCGPGSTVLLIGTGGVSVFALQLAKAMGARVLLVSRSADKAARATALGADAVHATDPDPAWDKWAYQQTNRRGVDLVVEVGGAGTLDRSCRAVRHGGHVALVGVLAGGGTFNPVPVLMKAVTLRGVFVGSRRQFAELNAFLTRHAVAPVIDRVFPFAQTADALAYLAAGGHVGKVVVGF